MGTFGQNFWKRQRRPRRFFVKDAQPPVQKPPQPIAANDYKRKQLEEEIPQPLPRIEKVRIS